MDERKRAAVKAAQELIEAYDQIERWVAERHATGRDAEITPFVKGHAARATLDAIEFLGLFPTAPDSSGAALIAAERLRQVSEEHWTADHDDEHPWGQLVEAAVAYARYGDQARFRPPTYGPPACWPWEPEWWKPASRLRSLVKAGALIAAEIDRLQRRGD